MKVSNGTVRAQGGARAHAVAAALQSRHVMNWQAKMSGGHVKRPPSAGACGCSQAWPPDPWPDIVSAWEHMGNAQPCHATDTARGHHPASAHAPTTPTDQPPQPPNRPNHPTADAPRPGAPLRAPRSRPARPRRWAARSQSRARGPTCPARGAARPTQSWRGWRTCRSGVSRTGSTIISAGSTIIRCWQNNMWCGQGVVLYCCRHVMRCGRHNKAVAQGSAQKARPKSNSCDKSLQYSRLYRQYSRHHHPQAPTKKHTMTPRTAASPLERLLGQLCDVGCERELPAAAHKQQRQHKRDCLLPTRRLRSQVHPFSQCQNVFKAKVAAKVVQEASSSAPPRRPKARALAWCQFTIKRTHDRTGQDVRSWAT